MFMTFLRSYKQREIERLMLPTPRAFYLGVNGIGTKEGAEFYDAVITIKSMFKYWVRAMVSGNTRSVLA